MSLQVRLVIAHPACIAWLCGLCVPGHAAQIFKQNGIEQYNPLGDKFDPNLHNALFQIPDPSKEVGTVASVTKVSPCKRTVLSGLTLSSLCCTPCSL